MNYRTLLVILVTLQPLCNGMEKPTHPMPIKNHLSEALINTHHNPTLALLKILEATNIKHDGTLSTIVTETQKGWLRTAGKERWENQSVFTLRNEISSQLLEDLFLTQIIEPSCKHYNYAILLGATVHAIRNRLTYLISLCNKGTHFDSIIVLTGKRPLDKNIENEQALLQNSSPAFPFKENWQLNGPLPQTETEMIKLVFDQTNLPVELNTIPLIFIDTPMQQKENGITRPNTQDTILEWIKLCNPSAGSILAISNQPFVGYQDAVLRSSLPKEFIIETVGNAYSANQNIATILDSLARWIYNENQYIQKYNH